MDLAASGEDSLLPSMSPTLQIPPLKRAKTSDGPVVKEVSSLGDGSNGDSLDLFHKPQAGDSLDYPRRRAVIACEICRSRKSRCDGGRPKCKLCVELDADCIYREPGIKLDAGDKLILQNLARIERLIQNRLGSDNAFASFSPADSGPPSEDSRPVGINTTITPGRLQFVNVGNPSANISAFPRSHTTPALHLLQWPVIKLLVSRPCDPQVLLQLEAAREPLRLGNPSRPLDLSKVSLYVNAFFTMANVWYAIVDPNTWPACYGKAATVDFSSGPESCIVLLVLGLGEAALSGVSLSLNPKDKPPPGLEFFAAAWGLLPSILIRNDILSAQCHILAAAYLMYLVRPLEAWNLLYNASMKLQLLLSSPNSIPSRYKELSIRVYWDSLMIESDLLAELDLPQSGIVQLEENIRLPRTFAEDAHKHLSGPGTAHDMLWYFLAEIALRRLLNRVSHLIYAKQHTRSFSAATLGPLVSELDYQLTQWHGGLPTSMKFPLDRPPSGDRVQTVLRLRYFACRTIIYRPYIQAVLGNEVLMREPGVQEACAKCLDACMQQLQDIAAHHEGHLPYLWQGALSIFSQTLLLMAATMSTSLSALLPSSVEMDRVIFNVVREIERLASLAPSLRLCAEILKEAEDKRHSLLRRGPNV